MRPEHAQHRRGLAYEAPGRGFPLPRYLSAAASGTVRVKGGTCREMIGTAVAISTLPCSIVRRVRQVSTRLPSRSMTGSSRENLLRPGLPRFDASIQEARRSARCYLVT